MIVLLLSCSEYVVGEQEVLPEAEPAGGHDPLGEAPDWDDCAHGYAGTYYNLPMEHPDVEPEEDLPPQLPQMADWWDEEYLAYRRNDGSLDFGEGWWPVDQGFEGDPGYFSAYWASWIRIIEDTDVEVVIGASDDFWVHIDGEPVYSEPGLHGFSAQVVAIPLTAGQYPIELHYAHRSGENGLRFRVASEKATICYPSWE